MTATAFHTAVAAVVDGHLVLAADVDQRLAELRSGAFGARLPGPHVAEGRNARRWVLQLLCAERIARRELAERGVVPAAPARPVALPRALALGGVAAAVLASVPEIGALDLGARTVGEEEVRAYYERNADLFAHRGVSLAAAEPVIRVELEGVERDRAFGSWLERRLGRDVVLAPGYEHPAEPGHPDSTHRH
jgi:[acyl-carrier-protein] S-malonyltransferase